MKQNGVALISALLVVALATTAAVKLAADLQLDMRRAANLVTRDQAWEYLLGGEQFVTYLIDQAVKNDRLYELLEQESTLPVDGGFISGKITDLQAKFNLNNLLAADDDQNNDQGYEQLSQLLASLDLEPGLGDAIRDWVDDDSDPFSGSGAEENFYLGLEVPYRPANRAMESPSELALIRGFSDIKPEKQLELLNEIATLPSGSKINVNSASKHVLSATGFNEESISTILARRDTGGAGPYENLDDLKELKQFEDDEEEKAFNTENLSVTTEYFLLEASAQIGRARLRLYSMIHRDEKGSMQIIARSLGAL